VRWNYTLAAENASTFAQLYLRPRDMLKLGILFRQEGRWGDRQVISREWVRRSTAVHTQVGDQGYGYYWWHQWLNVPTPAGRRRVDMVVATGNGGQKIYLVPSLDLIAVFTGGAYNAENSPPNVLLPARARGPVRSHLLRAPFRFQEMEDTMSARRPYRRIECEQLPSRPIRLSEPVLEAIDFYTNKLGFTSHFTWGEPPVNPCDVGAGSRQRGGCTSWSATRTSCTPSTRPTAWRSWSRSATGSTGCATTSRARPVRLRARFGHAIYNAGEPVPIERVDVPVRLEKRLAALLHDLAAHKRMSLSSCLEEILLHTNEPLGDGVASPHTRASSATSRS
jgi:hypothetical protein